MSRPTRQLTRLQTALAAAAIILALAAYLYWTFTHLGGAPW